MSGIHRMNTGMRESEKDDDGYSSFSLRIPTVLKKQIDARLDATKRSRNKEIELLLERQLESEVEKDKLIMEKMALLNSQNNPS